MTEALNGSTGPGPINPHQQLRRAAKQLDGVFYAQLFQAMRATVPEAGITEASSGEQVFTSMFDEKMAEMAAGQSENGLAEAMYRQLSKRLPPEESSVASLLGGEPRGTSG